jgi:hypothetical protein
LTVEVFCQTVLLHGAVKSGRRLTDLANEDEPFLAMNDIATHPNPGDTMIGLERQSRDHIAYLGTADEGQVGAAAAGSETTG